MTINKNKRLAKINPTHYLNVREWGGQWINISHKLMLTCGRIENYKCLPVLFLFFHCINICLLEFFYYDNIRLHLFICTSASSCEPTTSFVAHVLASDAYDIPTSYIRVKDIIYCCTYQQCTWVVGVSSMHQFYVPSYSSGKLEVESKNPLLTLGWKTSSVAAHSNSVHELLEYLVCTNSMYPPIHQVPNLLFSLWVFFWRGLFFPLSLSLCSTYSTSFVEEKEEHHYSSNNSNTHPISFFFLGTKTSRCRYRCGDKTYKKLQS